MRWRRRELIGAIGVGTVGGLAGCFGSGDPSCGPDRQVLELVLTEFEVVFPSDRRLDAQRVADRFAEEGYTTLIRSEGGVRVDTSIEVKVVVFGDVSESEVRSLVEETTDAEYTLSSDRPGSLFQTVDGEWQLPWGPTRIEQRVGALEAYGSEVGLTVPIDRAREYRVAVPSGGVATARRLLRPAAALTARLIDRESGELYNDRAVFATITRAASYPVKTETISVEESSDRYRCAFESSPSDLYAKSLFWPPRELPADPADAAIEFRVDGTHLVTRALTAAESDRLRWYNDNAGLDSPTHPSGPIRVSRSAACPASSPSNWPQVSRRRPE